MLEVRGAWPQVRGQAGHMLRSRRFVTPSATAGLRRRSPVTSCSTSEVDSTATPGKPQIWVSASPRPAKLSHSSHSS